MPIPDSEYLGYPSWGRDSEAIETSSDITKTHRTAKKNWLLSLLRGTCRDIVSTMLYSTGISERLCDYDECKRMSWTYCSDRFTRCTISWLIFNSRSQSEHRKLIYRKASTEHGTSWEEKTMMLMIQLFYSYYRWGNEVKDRRGKLRNVKGMRSQDTVSRPNRSSHHP